MHDQHAAPDAVVGAVDLGEAVVAHVRLCLWLEIEIALEERPRRDFLARQALNHISVAACRAAIRECAPSACR